MNSIKIEANRAGEFVIASEGFDVILNTCYEDGKLIMEVKNDERKTRAKIEIVFLTEDIIYFNLLEGETYSFIDYGHDCPYIRAPKYERMI